MARKRTIKRRKLIKKRALLPYRQSAKESTLQSLHNRNKRLEKMLIRHDERCKRQLLDRNMTIKILEEMRNTFGSVDLFSKRLQCSTAVPDVCAMSHVTNMKQYILHCFVTMTRMVNKKLIKEDGKTPTSASKTLRKEMEGTFQKIKGPIQSFKIEMTGYEQIFRRLNAMSKLRNHPKWNEFCDNTPWPGRIDSEHSLIDRVKGRLERLEREYELGQSADMLFVYLGNMVFVFSCYTEVIEKWLEGPLIEKERNGRFKRFANVFLPGWLTRRISQHKQASATERCLNFENQITEEMEALSRKMQQLLHVFSAELKLVVRKISRKRILYGG